MDDTAAATSPEPGSFEAVDLVGDGVIDKEEWEKAKSQNDSKGEDTSTTEPQEEEGGEVELEVDEKEEGYHILCRRRWYWLGSRRGNRDWQVG